MQSDVKKPLNLNPDMVANAGMMITHYFRRPAGDHLEKYLKSISIFPTPFINP
jgi:hypothetical protein